MNYVWWVTTRFFFPLRNAPEQRRGEEGVRPPCGFVKILFYYKLSTI